MNEHKLMQKSAFNVCAFCKQKIRRKTDWIECFGSICHKTCADKIWGDYKLLKVYPEWIVDK